MPSCIFTPDNTEDVSRAVKIFTKNSCAFAIRSGGHSYNPGWSSISNGILVSLGKMNSVKFYPGFEVVVADAGSRWENVYDEAERHGVTVVGGQNSDVGLGGYLLGGGISFLSNEYGWGADNVKGFQMVAADGSIVNANEGQNQDLFRALKGGSSNFGIVTGFTLNTVQVNGLNGVAVSYQDAYSDAFFRAAYQYCTSAVDIDPKSMIMFFASINETLHVESGILATYSDKMDWAKPPQVFKPFVDGSIPYREKQVTVKNGTLGQMGDVLVALQTAGRRTTRATISIIPEVGLFKKLRQVWAEVSAGYKNIDGFECELAFQPIGKKWIAAGQEHGGNSMGINSPIVPVWVQTYWHSAGDDAKIQEFEGKMIERLTAAAKTAGRLANFEYLNYAGRKQDVLSHYGLGSVKALTEVKKKYDPQNIFGTLVPGGFKIPGF
ncbi:hypothetical protein H072_1828 [Dactylellina haptotyla CBS 200.50]|uniref:FAD-binding PCMH-type domain-containing protein n=1 Tax=Dactylellina haptotyla (strain CBS 200.50) TaxID=1284197 RepID=S8C920_DACHA|nr:hypothetical protein H072_1828 [Dactylellina haptotyla CBS 200.50]